MLNESEPLNAEHTWLLRLAERLVGHPQDAQDLAQETWMQVLRTGREPTYHSRTWMAGVARNLALHLFRSKRRRAHREGLSVGPRSDVEVRAPSDSLDFSSMLARLHLAVLGLREPFREAIVQRYLEQLSLAQIAVHLDVPVNTVRSRLRRGLKQLRHEFEGEDIEGVPALVWVVAAASSGSFGSPGVRSGEPTHTEPAPEAHSTVRTSGAPGAFALAGAAALGFTLFGILSLAGESQGPDATRDARPGSEREATTARETAAGAMPGTPVRQSSARNALGDDSAVPTRPAGVHVVSVSGHSVVGSRAFSSSWAELGLAENGDLVATPAAPLVPIGTLNDTERIEPPGDARARLITVEGDLFVTVWAPIVGPGIESEACVVVSPRVAIWGTVVDDRNVPIEGVTIRLRYTDDLVLPEGASDGNGRLLAFEERSGVDGAFFFQHGRNVEGAVFEFTHPDHEPFSMSTTTPLPSQANRYMLPRTNPTHEGMDARVVDADGAPIPRAYVVTTNSMTMTGNDGGFALGLDPGESVESWIAAPGLAPTRVEVIGGSGRAIMLDEPAATLRGRLTDAEGEPISGFRIVLADPTVMVVLDGFAYTAEPITAGLRRSERGVSELLEVVTDAEGRFELRGLAHRRTRLWIIDPVTGLLIETEPLDVESEHHLVVPGDAWIPKVEGRVIDEEGNPVQGAFVNALVVGTRYDTKPANLNLAAYAQCDSVLTDDDGRFTLERVPAVGAQVSVGTVAQGIVSSPLDGDAPLEITLRPNSAYIFQVNRSDVDGLEFRDGLGETLTVDYRLALAHSQVERIPVKANPMTGAWVTTGAMGEAWVSTRARSVVFFDGDEIVDERSILPVLGRVGVIVID